MRLRISRAARNDLIDVWSFIAEDNPDRADSFLDEFYSLFQMLVDNPMIGRSRDELRHGVRSFPKGNYLVFYTLSDSDDLEVIRVLPGYRDIDKLFED